MNIPPNKNQPPVPLGKIGGPGAPKPPCKVCGKVRNYLYDLVRPVTRK